MANAPPPSNEHPGTMPEALHINTLTKESVEKIQVFIEKCIQMTLTREQAMAFLSREVGIEPRFSAIVWDSLVERHPDFFRAYACRIRLKQQVTLFNQILDSRTNAANNARNELEGPGNAGSFSADEQQRGVISVLFPEEN